MRVGQDEVNYYECLFSFYASRHEYSQAARALQVSAYLVILRRLFLQTVGVYLDKEGSY